MMTALDFKFRLIVGLIGLSIIAAPFWVYYNRHAVLQKLFPFRTLENKIALDGVGILDWADDSDAGEIYLVDTVSLAIRQLTDAEYMDKRPAISTGEDRVYFLSYRPLDVDQNYLNSRRRIHYFDIERQQVYSAESEFQNVLHATSDVQDLSIFKDKMAIVEDYDLARLYVIDLSDKSLLNQWIVRPNTIVVSWQDGWMTTRQDGILEKYEIRQ